MSKWTLTREGNECTITDENNAVVYEVFKRRLDWKLGDMPNWCYDKAIEFTYAQLTKLVEAHNESST